jgi:signal peptidase II
MTALGRRGGGLSVTGALALVGVLVLIADQLSKWVILLAVMQPPRVIEVTGFFNLVLVYNRGVSFGLLSSAGAGAYLLVAVSLAIVLALVVWVRRQSRLLVGAAGGLIAGGAFGNMLDRFIHPGVVDFLDFHLLGWHWPAFNLADSAIVVGVGLLVYDALFAPQDSGKQGQRR